MWKKIKESVVSVPNLWHQRYRPHTLTKPRALVDITTPTNARTLLMLMGSLSAGGYEVLLKLNPTPQVLRSAADLPHMESLYTVVTTSKYLPDAALYLTDSDRQPSRTGKTLRIRFDYRPNLVLTDTDLIFPYTVHTTYFAQLSSEFRQTPPPTARKFRCFFAGNYRQAYDNPLIRDVIGKVNRYEIIEHVRQNLPVRWVHNRHELADLLTHDYVEEIVILDQYTGRVGMSEWLHLLSLSDFFLAPPGIMIPLSHNIVEAMVRGAIPWTNYADWFIPPLQDGQTCIGFDSIAQMQSSFERICALDTDEIAGLRQNVLAYYQQHLDPAQFWQRVIAHPANLLNLHVLDERKEVLRRTFGK